VFCNETKHNPSVSAGRSSRTASVLQSTEKVGGPGGHELLRRVLCPELGLACGERAGGSRLSERECPQRTGPHYSPNVGKSKPVSGPAA
jgi:hypothetical protein